MLLDKGSQPSYVSLSVTSSLKLKPVNSENLHINTFGDPNYRKQKCKVVKLCLQTRNHKALELYALDFPVICSPLPNKIKVADYVHLEGLDFADNFDNTDSKSIDVLIGSDYYWDFVMGDSTKGNQSPTAIYSRFRWLLSGPVDKRKPKILFNGRNYEIGLPWKEDLQQSANSYRLRETRLRSLPCSDQKGLRKN